MSSMSAPLSLTSLRATVDGRVIAPDDPDYDTARAVALGGIDRRPAAIVQVANAADVARVVGVAREAGLELAVRSGGHSGAGHGASEGGLVLDLRAMKQIDVDVANRTAWAEAGITAGELTVALHAHGLAVGFGDTASVGIGGITTGGGIGYLSRRYGLTIDNLLGVDVVLAERGGHLGQGKRAVRCFPDGPDRGPHQRRVTAGLVHEDVAWNCQHCRQHERRGSFDEHRARDREVERPDGTTPGWYVEPPHAQPGERAARGRRASRRPRALHRQ